MAITPGVLRTPYVLAGKQSTKVNRHLACFFLLLDLARALTVRPYAESSKLSTNTTLSYTTDTILPGLGLGSQSLRGVAHPLRSGRKAVHQGESAYGLWSFSIVSGQRLDGKALCRHLQVVLHHVCILHHCTILPGLG